MIQSIAAAITQSTLVKHRRCHRTLEALLINAAAQVHIDLQLRHPFEDPQTHAHRARRQGITRLATQDHLHRNFPRIFLSGELEQFVLRFLRQQGHRPAHQAVAARYTKLLAAAHHLIWPDRRVGRRFDDLRHRRCFLGAKRCHQAAQHPQRHQQPFLKGARGL